jgi:ABC-type amino acid transport substrate-binding protein
MVNHTPRLALFGITFVVASLACGGGGDGNPTPTSGGGEEANRAAPNTPPVVGGSSTPVTFATIKQRGTLKVAADPQAPPFLSKNNEGGWQGFEYAIMLALSDRAGASVEIVPAQFFELPDKLKSGEADMAIGQMAPSSAYEGLLFSTSYLQFSLCLIVPGNSHTKALADLPGKKIGMYDDPVARQLTDVLVGSSYQRELFDDYGYFDKLAQGQLDAMVYDCPLAKYELKVWGDKLKIVDESLNVATYNVGVKATNKQLLDEVNQVLSELGNNGLLAALQKQWLGDLGPKDDYQSATGKVVLVKKGDTLMGISQRELGSPERWKELYEKNKDVVGPNPQIIYIGMQLRVPT